MPVLTGPVDADGALVDVLLGHSQAAAQARRQALQAVPPAVRARALIDTGAEVTCADPTLLRQLGLRVSGLTPANVPAAGGLIFQAQYDAGLTVLHPSRRPGRHLEIPDLLVMEVPLAALGYQVLLGRDMLALCRLLYDGPGGRFRLAY
jgi:hypothetical protein